MINFPNSPSVGQIFSAGGFSWRWDGVRWVSVGQVPLANPNKFHNGFLWFDQANEGSTVTIPSGGGTAAYMQDGLRYAISSSRVTGSQFQPMVAAGGGGLLPKACIVILTLNTNAIAAGDYVQLFDWLLEGNQLADALWPGAAAMPVTFSFWFSTTVAGTYSVAMRAEWQTPVRSYVIDFVAPGDGVFHFYQFTIPPDTNTGWYTTIFLSTAGIEIGINGGAGGTYRAPAATTWLSGNYVIGPGNTNPALSGNGTHQIGPHKLEVGSIATPIIRGSPSEELARCQRYYEKSYAIGTKPGTAVSQPYYMSATIGANAATAPWWGTTIFYKQTKRANATLTLYDATGASGVVGGYNTSSVWVNGVGFTLYVSGQNTAMFVPSGLSMVSFEYVADARL
jgi:hypothetical protein